MLEECCAIIAIIWCPSTPTPSSLRMVLAPGYSIRTATPTSTASVQSADKTLAGPSGDKENSPTVGDPVADHILQKQLDVFRWQLFVFILQAVFALALAIVAYFQYRGSEKQAEIIKRQAELLKSQVDFHSKQVDIEIKQGEILQNQLNAQEAAERAWIHISRGEEGENQVHTGRTDLPDQSTPSGHTFRPVTNIFVAHIKNNGKTPAHIRKISCNYSTLTKDEFKKLSEEPKYSGVVSGGLLTLFPTESFARSVELSGPVLDANAIKQGDQVIYFSACVEYEDAFGKARKTKVGFRWFAESVGPRPAGFWQAGPPAYNRAT